MNGLDFIRPIADINLVEQAIDDLINERVDEGVAAYWEDAPYSVTVAGKPSKNGRAGYGCEANTRSFLDSLNIHLPEYWVSGHNLDSYRCCKYNLQQKLGEIFEITLVIAHKIYFLL